MAHIHFIYILLFRFNIQTKLRINKEMINAIWDTISNIEIRVPSMDEINTTIPDTNQRIYEMFKEGFPVIDVDMDNIQETIKDVEDVLNYRPEVPPKPKPKQQSAQEEIPVSPPKPIARSSKRGSLTLKMASMFEGGRTIFQDQEVSLEVERFRRQFKEKSENE